jgi:signal transduction histidine kinase
VRPNSSQIDPTLVGAVLGIGACVVALSTSSGSNPAVIVLAVIPLLVRTVWRSMPLWFLLVATTVPVMIAEVTAIEPTSATWLVGCVAVGAAAIDRRTRSEWVPIVVVVGGPLWLWLAGAVDGQYGIFGIWTMGLVLSATLGTIVGEQRRLIVAMREAQAQLATAAAADERRRIARELHDLVGHSFSVVLLHLSGARHLMGTDPERAEAALRQAEEVGRKSMDDLRASLALLGSASDSYEPVGDLAALGGLVDGMRRAGLDATYSVEGELDDVDPAVGVVIYSVAREALTNAAKHAAPGPVSCELVVGDHAVLRVKNNIESPRDGVPRSNATGLAGMGLAGMGERVRAIGGTLHVDDSNGVWTVVLDVPAYTSAARDVHATR